MIVNAPRVAACLFAGAVAAMSVQPLTASRAPTGPRNADAARSSLAEPSVAAPGGTEDRDTIAVSAVIRSTLHEAFDSSNAAPLPAGARAQVAWRIADALEYRLDVSRELEPGTVVNVLLPRSVRPDGSVQIGEVLAARVRRPHSSIEVIRFGSSRAAASYFDGDGRSLRAPFLRAPLSFRRISSAFGPREHPILGGRREHRGIDYAARSGTPVHSVADGVVTAVGSRSGYGNLVEIRHGNGIATRYGHLRGFAQGMQPGRRVKIGETIGYVGMTGLATGPHLHFETLIDGVPRDPRATLPAEGGERIPSAERAAFDSTRVALLELLERRAGR